MTTLIKLVSAVVNDVHDLLIKIFSMLGFSFNDKQLHFIIIGLIGILVFLIVNPIFKYVAKLSVEVISFIYTLTVMIVFVFAIEIEQKITGRGNMEFKDITAGLWGFLEFFGLYLLVRLLFFMLKRLYIRFIPKERKPENWSSQAFNHYVQDSISLYISPHIIIPLKLYTNHF